MRIFIDDERLPLPSEDGLWTVVRDPQEAIALIEAHFNSITHLSFDNDLQHELEGRHILSRIIGSPVQEGLEMPSLQEIRVHSANTPSAEAMMRLAENAVSAGILPAGVNVVRRSALDESYPIEDTLLSAPERVAPKGPNDLQRQEQRRDALER